MGIAKNKWFPDSSNPLRVEPDGTWQHQFTSESYMRYALAMQYVGNKHVLDAGSGVCFGSSLLSVRAKSIKCANICQEELDLGREHFQFHCPALFSQCDFTKDFPTGIYDVITCFETMEHLYNPVHFVGNVYDNLYAGGLFIFSIPKTEIENRHDEKGVRIGHVIRLQKFQDVKNIIMSAFNLDNVSWLFQYGDNSIICDQRINPRDDKARDDARVWIGICKK